MQLQSPALFDFETQSAVRLLQEEAHRKLQRINDSFVQQFLDSQREMLRTELQRMSMAAQAAAQSQLAESLASDLDDWRKRIFEASGMADFLKRSDEFLERDVAAHEKLWSIGWVISMTMPIFWIHESANRALSQPMRAHAMMANWYSEKLDEIEASLIELHPARASILASAFAAHRRKEYALSVPVLLAQCDGISHDILNIGLYKSKGTEVARAIQNSPLGTYMKRIGAVLEKNGPIHADDSALDPNADPLNRHEVLHGRSVSYATRLKSLQVVALANFIGVDFTQRIRESEAELLAWRTSSDGLSVTHSHWEGKKASKTIVGTVANSSPHNFREVMVRFELKDKHGKFLKRETKFVGRVRARETVSFRAPFTDVVGMQAALPVSVVGKSC